VLRNIISSCIILLVAETPYAKRKKAAVWSYWQKYLEWRRGTLAQSCSATSSNTVLSILQKMQCFYVDFRYCGQAIFHTLMVHPLFERALRKHVSATVIGNIQSKLDFLRSKVRWQFIFIGYNCTVSVTEVVINLLWRMNLLNSVLVNMMPFSKYCSTDLIVVKKFCNKIAF